MHRISEIRALSGYKLAIVFDDGVKGTIDLKNELTGPVFGPLADEAIFRTVSVDPFGAVVWPNGADMAPDALYDELVGHRMT
jgi:hypothetical protein